MAGHSSYSAEISGVILVSWIDRYLNLPFVDGGRSTSGVDCWGLVQLVYRQELEIELPSYAEISAHDLINVSRKISVGKDGDIWQNVEAAEIEPFDVCVMRFFGRKRIGHVGLVVDKRTILHIERVADATLTPLSHYTIRERIECFRRHRKEKY